MTGPPGRTRLATMRLMPFYHRAPHDRQPLRPLVAPGRPAPDVTGARRWREVGYAVIDLETTGLSPAADAILEVGVVLTDADGQVERSWSTLIDPGPLTDVGPTAVHGLRAQDLVGAPALDDVADLLVRDLAGRAVVAHNARFDVGFLTQALGGRHMLDIGARVPRVCTMEWARHFMTTPSRRLTACCQAAGIVVGQHHTALDDAHAVSYATTWGWDADGARSRWSGRVRSWRPPSSPDGTGTRGELAGGPGSWCRAPHVPTAREGPGRRSGNGSQVR